MIVQKPHDGGGVFDACYSNVVANGTIAQNQTVVWDTTATGNNLGRFVVAGGAGSNLAVGVATHAAVAGDNLIVLCYGVYKGILTDGSVAAAGDALEPAASGAVRIGTTAPAANDGVLDKIGVAFAADVGTAADVFVRCM